MMPRSIVIAPPGGAVAPSDQESRRRILEYARGFPMFVRVADDWLVRHGGKGEDCAGAQRIIREALQTYKAFQKRGDFERPFRDRDLGVVGIDPMQAFWIVRENVGINDFQKAQRMKKWLIYMEGERRPPFTTRDEVLVFWREVVRPLWEDTEAMDRPFVALLTTKGPIRLARRECIVDHEDMVIVVENEEQKD
jgi:hypothetical protein